MFQEMMVRNYSHRTIGSYISMIAKISKHYHLSPDKITTSQFKDFTFKLISEQHASVSMVNQLISAWRILQTDVLERKWESFRIKRPKRVKLMPKVLSREEALRLVSAPSNLKHRTLLTLAYVTGMRRSEITALRVADIDSERKVIRILCGKGKKQREVQLPEKLLQLLREYYRRYRPSSYLFEGQIQGRPYSVMSISKVVKLAAQKAGITKNVSPHILRHSFATHMLEKGVNLKRLQMLMGHNSMKTTSVYLHLAHLTDVNLPNLIDER